MAPNLSFLSRAELSHGHRDSHRGCGVASEDQARAFTQIAHVTVRPFDWCVLVTEHVVSVSLFLLSRDHFHVHFFRKVGRLTQGSNDAFTEAKCPFFLSEPPKPRAATSPLIRNPMKSCLLRRTQPLLLAHRGTDRLE